jgi:hypothetical protein
MIAGAYPPKVDQSNKDHMKIVKAVQNIISSLQYTLPCSYCRQSYGRFIKQLPAETYAGSRRSMMKWLYLLHDMINKKLIKQEKECFEIEKAKLLSKSKSVSPERMKKLKAGIIKTKPSPSFERVLAMYEKQRAGCSKRAKHCA